jgi:leukotriene-A4 hydrolase
MKFIILLLLIIITCTYSRRIKTKRDIIESVNVNKDDNLSYSQKDGAIQTKLDFDLEIDMKQELLFGTVKINFKCIKDTDIIGLDVRDLVIDNIYDKNNVKLSFVIVKNNKNSIGDGLIVKFEKPCKANEESYISIKYSTKQKSIGVHFSDRSVINESSYGFMYTHGEAIYSRTVFPSQDTPIYKVTSSAKIKVKNPYIVLYSGILKSKEKSDDYLVYNYEMDKPIPTYLITIAVGMFEKHVISNRCEVWGEKPSLKLVPQSFQLCDQYIDFYSNIKPFAFKKMVFLIMPNDFPYSGTENPYVTYISEDMLSADKSYSNTIAHEIAHFWSGNLVTNKGWDCFWLNEGITTYLTRKALKHFYGEEEYKFQLDKGLRHLNDTIEQFKENYPNQPSLRSLNQQVKDDPYISFSKIPYEKGSLFMYYIEQKVGNEKMIELLSEYFETFQFKTIGNSEFVNFWKPKVKDIEWDKWINGTEGIPVDLKIQSSKGDNIDDLVSKLLKNNTYSKEELNKLSSKEKVFFLSDIYHQNKEIKHWKKIHELINDKNIFKDEDVRVKAIINLIQIISIENKTIRIKLIEKTLQDFKYYKVFYLKMLFKILKISVNDTKELEDILNKYTSKLNPITMARIKEYIDKINITKS